MDLYMGTHAARASEERFMRLGLRNCLLLRAAVLAMIAATAGACSSLPSMPSIPDWVDPTTWFGDDNANPSDNGQTPDLASLPSKPTASTPDDQREATDQLAADRANAKYSADALRGGTEAAAAPPPTVAPTQVASEEEGAGSSASAGSTKPAPAAASTSVQVASVDRSVAQAPIGSAVAGTLPPTAPGGYAAVEPPAEPVQTASLPQAAPTTESTPPAAAPQVAAAPEAPVAAPTQPAKPHRPRHHVTSTAVASAEPVNSPPVGAQPAMPPSGPTPQQMASIAPSDAALGFRPSTAPSLDPGISQFVAAPIIEHYRETAADAGIRSASPHASAVASNQPVTRKLRRPSRAVAEGGPEQMTGAVVANLDALAPTTPAAATTPPAYANPQGLPATAIVFFPGDAVRLNSEGRSQVHDVVAQFRQGGAQGYIRVVGHSSSRTADMSPEKHMEIIFRKSQQRADAVAQELIREGVPADKVLVEAVGDTEPVYYESMPKGEEGNRRAEIFLQS